MTRTTSFELFRVQLKLECKAIAGENVLARTPCDDPEDLPRVLVAELDGAVRVLVRHDLAVALRRAVLAHDPRALLDNPTLVESILGAEAPTSAAWVRSYTVPIGGALPATDAVVRVSGGHPPILAAYHDRGFYDMAWRSPVFAVVHRGEVVSACMSWREDADAAEAWVATDPAHRGRGYGKVAVAAWAKACHDARKVAFYSHKEANVASAGVARTLGLPRWGRMASFA